MAEIENLLAEIRKTDSAWSSEVILCVQDWLNEKYPNDEVWFLLLPRWDNAERLRLLELFLGRGWKRQAEEGE